MRYSDLWLVAVLPSVRRRFRRGKGANGLGGERSRVFVTRRHLLGWIGVCLSLRAGPAAAQVVDWSTSDEARYRAFRAAFEEYGDLSDRDFSARMEALFRTLDGNPNAPVVVAEVTRRLPEYADAPPTRVKREMSNLFRKAKQHFASAAAPPPQPPRQHLRP